MYWDNKPLWAEGMFLRTQHFQQFERYLERNSQAAARWLQPLGWGFAQLEIDEALLKTGIVALARASGILPDGTIFELPGTDDHPLPLDIPADLKDQVIYLALPIRREGGVSSRLSPPRVGDTAVRWTGQEIEVADTVAGSEARATLVVGKLELRLMHHGQERAGYVTLPLARLVEKRLDGSVVLDPAFIPTAVSCAASERLTGVIAEMRGLLQHRGAAIANRLSSQGGKSTAEISDFLILMLVNRNDMLLRHLGTLQDLHPEALYRVFSELAGELATFTETTNRPPVLPPYNHAELQASFAPLVGFLRDALSAVFEQTAIPIPLEDRAFGIRVARITDRAMFADCVFIIAARSSIDAELLRANLPKRTTIGAVERIRDLVNLQLGGAPIRPLPAEPRQIPFRSGMIYFEINAQSEDWRLIEQSGGVAVHVSGDVPDLALELWAIRGRIR